MERYFKKSIVMVFFAVISFVLPADAGIIQFSRMINPETKQEVLLFGDRHGHGSLLARRGQIKAMKSLFTKFAQDSKKKTVFLLEPTGSESNNARNEVKYFSKVSAGLKKNQKSIVEKCFGRFLNDLPEDRVREIKRLPRVQGSIKKQIKDAVSDDLAPGKSRAYDLFEYVPKIMPSMKHKNISVLKLDAVRPNVLTWLIFPVFFYAIGVYKEFVLKNYPPCGISFFDVKEKLFDVSNHIRKLAGKEKNAYLRNEYMKTSNEIKFFAKKIETIFGPYLKKDYSWVARNYCEGAFVGFAGGALACDDWTKKIDSLVKKNSDYFANVLKNPALEVFVKFRRLQELIFGELNIVTRWLDIKILHQISLDRSANRFVVIAGQAHTKNLMNDLKKLGFKKSFDSGVKFKAPKKSDDCVKVCLVAPKVFGMFSSDKKEKWFKRLASKIGNDVYFAYEDLKIIVDECNEKIGPKTCFEKATSVFRGGAGNMLSYSFAR